MKSVFAGGSLLIIFSVFSMGIKAQELLDPITVSSSLVEKRSSETGRNISIIRGEAFNALPVHSVDELLKYIPGVEAQMRGPAGSQTDFSIRGGTFQQVLVILDGLRLNDPNTGHFSGYIPITPAEIDRIEVLKGASSAIYGSDAVGGVIHIITKAFSNSIQKNKTQVLATAAGGEYGLFTGNAGGFYQNGQLNIGGGLLTNQSTGVLQRGTRGYFHNTAASAGVQIKFNPYWHLSMRTAYDSRSFGAQNFYTIFASDTASEKISSWWNQARLQFKKNRSTVSLDAGYKSMEDTYYFNPSSLPNNNKSHLFQTQLIARQAFSEKSTLVTGIHFQNRNIRSNDRGNHEVNVVAPFMSWVHQMGHHFMLNPSLRMELFGHQKAEWIPQLTTSYKINQIQLRASGGKTLRNADFTELYNNYNKPLVKSGSIGNPGLIAETSWNYELGADWFYNARLKLSTSFFQRFHNRLIDWVPTPYANMPRKDNLNPGSTYALATNLASVKTSGWETDASFFQKFTQQQSLRLQAGMVWLYSESSEAQPSFYLLSHARFLTNFMAIYELGPVSLSLTGLYKSRTPQKATVISAQISKDYFLLNGRVSYKLLRQGLTAFAQVDNIFDRSYSDLLGAPMPGRWLQGGLSFQLNR